MQHHLLSDTDNAEVLNQFAQDMFARLNLAFAGRRFDTALVHDLEEAIRYERTQYAMRGVKVPDLTLLLLPSVPAVEIVRKDLDAAGIQRTLRRLVGKYGAMSNPGEFAACIKRAFPHHRAEVA